MGIALESGGSARRQDPDQLPRVPTLRIKAAALETNADREPRKHQVSMGTGQRNQTLDRP
jgi:hypothetical protein